MKDRESSAGADHPLQPAGYRPRIAEQSLDDALGAVPMVLVEGAKGCGKTWLALSRARTKMMLAEDPDALWAAQTLPHESLSSGPRPLLVDEWQRAPHVWDTARGSQTRTTARASSCSPGPMPVLMPSPGTQAPAG